MPLTRGEMPLGGFLPIEDWNIISQELHLDLPQWQKEMIDARLAQYRQNPTDILYWESITTGFDKEDEAI